MGLPRYYLRNPFSSAEVTDLVTLVREFYSHTDECFVRVFNKSTRKYYFYNIQSLKDRKKLAQIVKKFGKNNLMFSLNTFRTMERATEANLFAINIIAVDLDYKDSDYKDLTPEQVIQLLELDYFDTRIPTPTYIEYSNQIRLIYKLKETVYLPKRSTSARTLANRVSEHIASELSEFGANKQKLETYFRPPGSINAKTNDVVKMIKYENTEHFITEYTLREIQELWMEEVPSWYNDWKNKKKSKSKSKEKVFKFHNIYTLNQRRLADFEKIQAYMNENKINKGRGNLCFLYRNYVLLSLKYSTGDELGREEFDEAEKRMQEFNSNFNYPRNWRQLESESRHLERRQYLYSNAKLMFMFNLTQEECAELGLESIYECEPREEYQQRYYLENKEEISKNKKRNYRENLKKQGKKLEKESIEERKAKIKDLRAKGLTIKQVAQQLNCSEKTVKRYS